MTDTKSDATTPSYNLDSTQDVLRQVKEDRNYKPIRSPKVSLMGGDLASGVPYVIKSETTGDEYNVDFFTVTIWWLLDGEHTINQIVSETKGKSESTSESAPEIISFLAEEGLLAGTEPDVIKSSRLRFVSAFELDYTLSEKDPQFFLRFRKFVRFFAQGIGLWVTVILIAMGALFLAPDFLSILFNRSSFEVFGSSVLGFFFYYLLLFPALVIHEIAHGATLAYYGALWDVMPAEVGTGLYYFGPMFYVDTSDSWVLPRKMRVMVSLSGPLSTLLIGALLVVADVLWPNQTLKMASFFCFYWMLWNFVPLIETDGYYAVMDYVDIPNLRKEAFDHLKSKIFRRKRPDDEKFDQRQRTFLTSFAVFSIAFVLVLAYQTYVIFQYMAYDTFNALIRVLQARSTNLLVDVVSIAYFALMAIGFLTMPFSLLKRTRKEATEV
ncbi:MAG TPA: hypothetical protein VLV18_08335 [Terriglobales bacterium]|nr:hypothetical protein [Terriglobales bacterium]